MSLPPIIEEIVGVIGHGRAMALVHEFGGQELRVPSTEDSDTWAALAEVIGERSMGKLAKVYGGADPIYIPFCTAALRAERNRKIIGRYEALIREGHSTRGAVSVLVREFKLNHRHIERIVNSPLPEPSPIVQQGQLF